MRVLWRATPTSACHTYFSVSHPLQRATPTVTQDVRIRGHLRGPGPLTPVGERFAVELSLRVLTTLYACRNWGLNPDLKIVARRMLYRVIVAV